jgi:steroid 5-alpha reductase family enzyme
MEIGYVLAVNAAAIIVCMTLLWLLSLWLRDVSIVDVFWGLGFVLVSWITVLSTGLQLDRSWLLVGMTSLWGVRLAAYLAWRNIGKGEDKRYAAMRDKRGSSFRWTSLFIVFWLQGAIMWVVALPLQLGIPQTDSLSWLDAVGCLLWSVGLFFESVGDFQMARFKSDPSNRGKVFDRGLWRYTRHPNYFGDFLVWWGLFTVAWSAGAPWWTVISPALMSFFLLRVSGVTLLESSLRERTEGYREYVARTSAFFPLPPRS